jgi:hypothetical protein
VVIYCWNVGAQQTNLRFDSSWRQNFNTEIAPWRVKFVLPPKTVRLILAENGSGISFDLLLGRDGLACLEDHHIAINRGGGDTDQTRYSQSHNVNGKLTLSNRAGRELIDPRFRGDGTA